MSREHEQIKHLLRSGKAHIDFVTRGKLPKAVKPESPLITYLELKSPQERLKMANVRLGRSLGYESGASFTDAAALLRYLKPRAWMVGAWPASSYKLVSFNKKITDAIFYAAQK
jgi:hypothetical protein